ncbi:MAG: gamma-butyrobetaine hydroxylase-like domain-containing protein [Egibacteraceae bacterium]
MLRPQPPPSEVTVERGRAVVLRWADGHLTELPLPALRRRCPCVACHDARAGGGVPVAERLDVAGAELVGAYGLALAWTDGHGDGVYSWEVLRSWCVCATCDPAAGGGTEAPAPT